MSDLCMMKDCNKKAWYGLYASIGYLQLCKKHYLEWGENTKLYADSNETIPLAYKVAKK